MVMWYYGTMVLWCFGVLVLWCFGVDPNEGASLKYSRELLQKGG